MSKIYGKHTLPFNFKESGLELAIEDDNDKVKYRRQSQEENIDKEIVTKNKNFYIHPIEPLNLPKELSSALLIELEKPIIIDSGMKNKIYAKFPLEIAVFSEGGSRNKPIDIFSFNKNKFTLYGDVKEGTICKYWSTETYSDIPDSIETLKEGVLEITIKNKTKEWKEVNKIVLNAYDMKIYFNEENVSMKSHLTIKDDDLSETSVLNNPLFDDMLKAREVYRKKTLSIKNKSLKFIMDSGI